MLFSMVTTATRTTTTPEGLMARTLNGIAGGRLPAPARKAVLTAHIIVSVGLLGDSAGFLAVAIRAAVTSDPASAIESVKVLEMFSVVFNLPLSVATILTGVTLGLGTRWGVFRYPWVTAKLALVVSVMVVGGAVIGPALNRTLAGGDGEGALIAAAGWEVLALGLATGCRCSSREAGSAGPGRRE
jgi:uncharacterized membrane protein